MSIQQTNQLILLILNSVLMTLLAAVLLGGAWLRQNSLLTHLHQVRSRYYRLTNPAAMSQPPEAHTLKKAREQRQQLTDQYHWSRVGLLALHVSVLVFGMSVLALALRSLISFDSLIAAALFLFVLGAVCLLVGTGCLLIDLAHGTSCRESLGRTFAQVVQQLRQFWSMPKVSRLGRLRRREISR